MTAIKIKARDLIVEVETDTPDEWVRVENLDTITINLGENVERAVTTDNDSDGAYEEMIMQRGASMTLNGSELIDDETGDPQPGRGRVEECAGEDKLGYESLNRYRFRHPLRKNWRVWTATTVLGEIGGETNAIGGWSATITKSGKTSTMPVEESGGGE